MNTDETRIPLTSDDSDRTPPLADDNRADGDPRQLPRRFGDYELLEEIARGGMGVVYKARQIKLDRLVALKMILAGQLASDEAITRFYTEAESAGKLDHPHIVPVYDVGEEDGQHYLAMAFVDGQSLKDHVRDRPLPPKEAAELMRTIATAVQYAHEQGIVHRDLKPANIIMASGGRQPAGDGSTVDASSDGSERLGSLPPPHAGQVPRITDFGLAKRIDAQDSPTLSGQIMGTPSYMPPEQALGHLAQIGPQSDVYALGAVLYHLLTGRPPFQAAAVADLLNQVIHTDAVPPRDLNPSVHPDLDTICMRCLEKDSAKRPASADLLASYLDDYLEGRPVPLRPVSRAERFWRWCKRHPARAGLMVTACVAVLALVGLSVGFVYQQELKGKNSELATAKLNLQDSLKREEGLNTQLKSALGETEQARDNEKAAKERVAFLEYVRSVNLALREWNAGNVERARQLLDDCEPRWRNWEWHYAFHVCHPQLRSLRSHKQALTRLAFSRDGAWLVSTGYDKTVKLWNAETDRLQRTLTGFQQAPQAIAVSPHGKTIATSGPEKSFTIWDAETGKPVHAFGGHTAGVQCLAFSPDGAFLASGDRLGTWKLWDLAKRREVHSQKAHGFRVADLAFNGDGSLLVTGGDTTVKLWDTGTGTEKRTLTGHQFPVDCVAVSPDGKRIVSGGNDKDVRLWDAATGKTIQILRGHTDPVVFATFSSDGQRVITASKGSFFPGSDGNTVKLWDAATGKELRTLRGHTGAVFCIAVTRDARRIATGYSDKFGREQGTIKLWSDAGRPGGFVFGDPPHMFLCMAVGPDGRRLVTASPDPKSSDSTTNNTLKWWDPATGILIRTVQTEHTGPIHDLAFHANGKLLATASLDRTVRLWNAGTGKLERTLVGHRRYVTCVAFGPDGRRLASAGLDRVVKLWDTETGKPLEKTLTAFKNAINCLAFQPKNGNLLAIGGGDKAVTLWNPATGETAALQGHVGSIRRLAFSPDGKRLTSAGTDNTARLWNVENRRELHVLTHAAGVNGVAFSADGTRVVTVGEDKAVHLWDAETGEEVLTLRGHTSFVRGVAFFPQGKRIATIGGDNTIRIWDARSSQWSGQQYDRRAE